MSNYTPGAGALWGQKTSDEIPTQYASSAGGLASAKAVLSVGGLLQMPDLGLALGASWAKIGLVLFDANGNVYLSRFHVADGTDPTKRAGFLCANITTGIERTIELPDWSGILPLPIDFGGSGTFLKSNGAGVQPSWAAVSLTNALLDGSNHTDTVAQAVLRGALVVGNSTPKWDRLAIWAANTILFSNGTDPSWASVASLTALQQHDLLLHLKPVTVTNCSWANGSTNITHASGGFANVKVGDYVYLGDNTGTSNQGRRVTVWNNSNSLTVDATNGNATLTNQTFIFFPGDHWDDTLAMDSVTTGGGLFCTAGRGTYTTVAGGTFQEIQGPIRWRAHASGAQDTDFRVQGSKSVVTPSGFALDRQGTANRVYFYTGGLTAIQVLSIPNTTGTLLTDGSTASVSNKALSLGNNIEMDGTSTYTVFTLSGGGADRLVFDFTGMTTLRSMTWPDIAGKVKIESAVGTMTGATPAIAANRVYKVSNGGATNMTNITGAADGAEVTLLFTNANTTLKDTSTTGSFELPGSADITPVANEVFKFVWVNADSKWYCVSRSQN